MKGAGAERNLAQLQSKSVIYIQFLDFADDIQKVVLLTFLVLVH